MAPSEWTAEGELRGEVVLVQHSYPIEYTLKDTDTGERVVQRFFQPKTESRSEPIDLPIAVQRFELAVTAERSQVEALVERLLETVTSCLSFGSRRSVDWTVGPLTEQDPNGDHAPESLYLTSRAGTLRKPVGFRTGDFNQVFDGVGDLDDPRGRKLVRSIRWLSRSRQTADFVEEFSFLVMSLASLHPLLPNPPGDEENGSSEAVVLRHFAVDGVGIDEDDWKEVGYLRHELFHGGLLEAPESRERLSSAIPTLRRTVIAALQELLDLPDEIPGSDPIDELGFVVNSVSFRPEEDDEE